MVLTLVLRSRRGDGAVPLAHCCPLDLTAGSLPSQTLISRPGILRGLSLINVDAKPRQIVGPKHRCEQNRQKQTTGAQPCMTHNDQKVSFAPSVKPIAHARPQSELPIYYLHSLDGNQARRTVMQSTLFKSRKDFVVSVVGVICVVLMVEDPLCELLCGQSRRRETNDVTTHQLETEFRTKHKNCGAEVCATHGFRTMSKRDQ